MLSLYFIPKSMFYTQSVVRSLQSSVRVLYWPCKLMQTNFHQNMRRHAFITKTRTITLFTYTPLNCLGFIYTVQGIFTSKIMKHRTCRYTKRSQTTAFCLYGERYNLSVTVHNLDSEKSAISHNTWKKAHGRTWRCYHLPLKNFFGEKIGIPRYIRTKSTVLPLPD